MEIFKIISSTDSEEKQLWNNNNIYTSVWLFWQAFDIAIEPLLAFKVDKPVGEIPC